MIKCEVIKNFSLKEFDKLKNIQRKNLDTKGKLYVGDTFDCDKKMADYLTGNNLKGDVVVKVIEVIPEEDVFEKFEEEVIDNVEYAKDAETKAEAKPEKKKKKSKK